MKFQYFIKENNMWYIIGVLLLGLIIAFLVGNSIANNMEKKKKVF